MPAFTTLLWDVLSTAGGTLALTFIVALALGINALTLLFLGSAAVALERFARAIRGWRSPIGVSLAWSVLVGVAAVYWGAAELGNGAEDSSLGSTARVFATSAIAVWVAVGLTVLVLRGLSASRLADGVLIWLGVAFALIAGSSGRLVYAAAVLGVVHFLWQVKADLLEPGIYAGVLGMLLGVRLYGALRRP